MIDEILKLPLPGIRKNQYAGCVVFDLDGEYMGLIMDVHDYYQIGVVDVRRGVYAPWHGKKYDASSPLHVFAIAQLLLQQYPPKGADHS